MTAGWRATARLVATAVAAAAVSRAAESLRRLVAEVDPPQVDSPVSRPKPLHRLEPVSVPAPTPSAGHDHRVAAQVRPSHDFGPTPVVTPSRGVGFRSEPVPPRAEMPVISRPAPEPEDLDQVAPAEPVLVPDGVRTAASIVQDLRPDPDAAPEDDDEVTTEAETVKPAEVVEPSQGVGVKTPTSGQGKHRRDHGAISGTVQSSRGRGLRGVPVSVVDETGALVGTALTGAGGTFVVEDLAAGRYVVAVSDADGDFAPGWHGGATQADASTVKVKDGKTRRKADVTLVATAEVDLDVDIGKKKAVVRIRVVDRATGAPAAGTVRGSAGGSPALPKKVRVDYLGSEHTRPAEAVARLR